MKILFIQTGWTIDKDYPQWAWSYAFEIWEPAIKKILEKIIPSFDYEIISLIKKDSLDITEEDRNHIYEKCLESEYDKIIITHWTDTMTKTAIKLSQIKNKIIIITWALLPETFKQSDADFNVWVTIWAINVLDNWIYIAMSWRIFEYDKVKKDEKTWRFIDI